MTTSGNAYLRVFEKEEDIFIARRNTNRSLDGDRVLVYQIKKRNNGKREGKVVEVLERATQDYVGILEIKKDFGFVNMRGTRMSTDFLLKRRIKKFYDGDKVVVRFKDWPKRASSPFGEIIKSLGKPGELNEMHAIMFEYGFPNAFPTEVEDFAQQLNLEIEPEEISKRKDSGRKQHLPLIL